MISISDLKVALELVERVLKDRKANKVVANRDRVLTSIYKMGDDGAHGVSGDLLLAAGFTKLQIIDAVDALREKGWVSSAGGGAHLSWLLKSEGKFYAEGLLEEAERRR